MQYEAGQNAPVGGLENGEQYVVQVFDATTVRLRPVDGSGVVDLTSDSVGTHQLRPVLSFETENLPGEGSVDVSNDIIDLGAEHFLNTGDKIQYYDPRGDQPVGGTFDQLLTSTKVHPFYVIRVSDTQIQLAKTQSDALSNTALDLTDSGTGIQTFTLIERNSGDRDHLTFQNASSVVSVNNDAIQLSYNHGFTTGQRVSLQLDPNRFKPTSPISGITAQKYDSRPNVYEPTEEKSYFVERINSTTFKLALTAEDLAVGNYIDLALVSGASRYRFMPTWHFGQGEGITRVDVPSDAIIFESSHGFVDGEEVRYELDANQSAIGGLTDGETYFVKRINDNQIQLSTTPAGAAIDLTSDGVGAHRFLRVGASFVPENNIQVDIPDDAIVLPEANQFAVGDAIEYRAGTAQAIGGLMDGATYFVTSVEGQRIQLSATEGGAAIDLTAAGGAGEHQFVRAGTEFNATNDIAEQRRSEAIALADRLSNDLGITVTLTAGNATSDNDPAANATDISNGRKVSFRDVEVRYDEQQIEKTKLLAGITNGYAFMGSDFGGDDETGVKVENTNLGLALFQTIDYTQPLDQQSGMTYAFMGEGEGGIVGLDDVTLEGQLKVELNRTQETVSETITTPSGEIELTFATSEDLTRITGAAELNIANTLALSGQFGIENRIDPANPNSTDKLLIGATDVAAFVGSGYETADELGVKLTNASFGMVLPDANSGSERAYALEVGGDAELVGVPGVTLTGEDFTARINRMGGALDEALALTDGTAIALQFSADEGSLTTVEGMAALALGDVIEANAQVVLDFGAPNASGQRDIDVRADDISLFVGSDAGTTDLSDDVGARLSNGVLNLALKADDTYQYTVDNADIELVGLELFEFESKVTAIGDQDNLSLQLSDLELTIGNLGKITGDFTFDAKEDGTIELTATEATAFVGLGLDTADESDDQGLSLTSVGVDLTIQSDGTYTYTLTDAQAALQNIDGIDFSGVVSATGDQDSIDVLLDDLTLRLSDYARLSGDFQFSVTSDNGTSNLQFTSQGIDAFVGYGAATEDESDDVGVAIANAALDLTLENGAYTYDLSNGTVALEGVDDLILSADGITAEGNQSGVTVTLDSIIFEAGGNGRFEGEQILFKAQEIAEGLTVDFSGENLSAFIGDGADTETIADDLGLSITDADLVLAIAPDQAYSYSFNAAEAAIRGQDAIELSATNINATGTANNTTVDLGSFGLRIGDNANLSGNALRFNSEADALEFGATGVEAFLGTGYSTSDALGVALSAASLGLILSRQAGEKPKYVLKASGSAVLLGVSDVTLSGDLNLELNATGAAVQETIILSNGEVLELNLADSGVTLPRISGNADLDIAGFAALSGEFAIEQQIVETNGQQQNQLLIGARNVNAFVGNNGGTANAVGLGLSDGELGLYIEQTGTDAAGYALKAEGSAALQGVDGVTLSGDVDLSLNKLGRAINQVLTTPDGDFELGFSTEEANLQQITGQLALGVDGFAELSGEFGIEKKADALHIGGRDIDAFIGANGDGLQISETELGLVLYTNGPDAGYAVQGQGKAALVGIDEVTLAGEVSLSINRTGQVVDETIVMPGEDIKVSFDSDAELTQVNGNVALDIAGFVGINGELLLDKQTQITDGVTTTDLLLGITNANAFVGAGFGSADAVGVELSDAQLGLIWQQVQNSNTGEQTQGYALKGSGDAGLVGIDGLGLSGTLNLAINRMGEAVDQTIALSDSDAIALQFTDGQAVTDLSGTAALDFGGVVQASGQFGIQKDSITNGDVTTTKLLVGLDDARTFIGAEGGSDAAAGIELSDGNLGLVIYSESNQITGAQESTYAMTASGAASLVGVEDLSLDGTLAVRINATGEAVDETVQIGTDESLQIVFDETQGNQMRIEGTVSGNAADALAFGGEFSMEWFTEQIPGALNQASNPDLDDLGLTQYQTEINSALYQSLRQQLIEEKER